MMYLRHKITFKSHAAPPGSPSGAPRKLRNDKPVRGDERADGDGGLQPLLYIQVTGRFVEHETAAEEQKVGQSLTSETKTKNRKKRRRRFLTCRLSGCRRRRRRTSAALHRTDPPRSSPAGESGLWGGGEGGGGSDRQFISSEP